MTHKYIVSLAFTVQRRRRIFADDWVKSVFQHSVETTLKKYNAVLISLTYIEDSAVCIETSIPITMTVIDVFRIIRRTSAEELKKQCPELQTMRSIWSSRLWCSAGRVEKEDKDQILLFVHQQRNR